MGRSIVFLHPDLGIGGAERLVVDAAVALKNSGNEVVILTPHHDPQRCFEETKDGTVEVVVVGSWIPRNFLGRFHALFAYLRMVYVALYLVLDWSRHVDVIICDQVSACVPFLQLRRRVKVLFYCHFPDQLLTDRQGPLKKAYRYIIDRVEEVTTGMANRVVVNSNYTLQVFRSTFPYLKKKKVTVLYPCIQTAAFDNVPTDMEYLRGLIPNRVSCLFLSINRFELKKNHTLAVKALHHLLHGLDENERDQVHLVITGGYDDRLLDNRSCYNELCDLIEKQGLTGHVTLVRSCTHQQKVSLLRRCVCLVYTPQFEHFGIVPLEAMYLQRPVIACNTGGTLETVQHNRSGFLCDPSPEFFANCMRCFVRDPTLASLMGKVGQTNVCAKFTHTIFQKNLSALVSELVTA